jgi:hypothetical protein
MSSATELSLQENRQISTRNRCNWNGDGTFPRIGTSTLDFQGSSMPFITCHTEFWTYWRLPPTFMLRIV